jgi:hypothetical protein
MTVQWRHLRAHETDHERLWLSVGLAGAALALLWQASGPSELPVFRCPFKALTAWPCVTCGGTRAFFALLNGAPLEALRWNPLVTLTLAVLAVYGIYAAIVATFDLPRVRVTWPSASSTFVRTAVWAAVAANWIFLIVDGR